MKKSWICALCMAVLLCILSVGALAVDYVYYENDFSDSSTLSDFTQYRGEWGIVDGQLMLLGLGKIQMTDQGFLAYTKDEGIANLTDFTLEVDMMNIQTQGGPIFRCDPKSISDKSNNSFYGYQTFISFKCDKTAVGRGNGIGDWGGNLKVSDTVVSSGMNVHMKVVASGKNFTYTLSDLDTGAELWNYSFENDEWASGTFGFRACIMNEGLTNLAMLGFDNLKITANGEVGDHLASGKPLSTYKPKTQSAAIMPKVTPAIEVNVPAVVEVKASDIDMSVTDYVYYENDFSNPATLSDFTQYRGDWAIRNGGLYYDAATDGFKETSNFSFILFSKDHDANLLTDYTVEADVVNSQTAAGILSHADLSQANSDNSSAIYGYLSFISNDGKKSAVGYGNSEGNWGGNLNVSEQILTPGSTYHLKVVHKDGMLTYTVTDNSGSELYSFSAAATDWNAGAFGFRARNANGELVNIGKMYFDNLKVTVHGEQAALLSAGYHPNAKIIGGGSNEPVVSTEATVNSDETTVPDMTDEQTGEASAELTGDVSTDKAESAAVTTVNNTDDSETKADNTTTASSKASTTAAVKNEDGGVNVGLIIGIVAAVIVVIAVVAVIIVKKKK